MDKRFSFGVLRSKQTRLRGLCGTAGTVCLGLFSADSVAVKSGVLNQVERARRKAIMPNSA
jgi:ammonia channel protein AmtB